MRFEIDFGGSKRVLNFNVFSSVELAKILEVQPTPDELMDAILKLNERNSMLMFKALIYCGIIGNDYEVSFKQSITQSEVGELISKATDAELTGVFNAFADAMGFNLKAEVETETTPKKKQISRKSKP